MLRTKITRPAGSTANSKQRRKVNDPTDNVTAVTNAVDVIDVTLTRFYQALLRPIDIQRLDNQYIDLPVLPRQSCSGDNRRSLPSAGNAVDQYHRMSL